MSVKVNIPAYLQPYVDGAESVEVSGGTAAECLTDLVEKYPGMGKMLFAEEGGLLDYVSVYVDGQFAYAEELARPVSDGGEMHILYILGGG